MTTNVSDTARPMFAAPISDWFDWFAWKPVQRWDGRWAWLRWVKRRRCQNHAWLSHTALDQWWQYA